MIPHPDDPRLTAYLSDELPADEAATVERALAADPELRLALEELATFQQTLTTALAPGCLRLRADQREAIRHAARQAAQSTTPIPYGTVPRLWQTWRVPLAAAAAITLAALLIMMKSGHRSQATVSQPPAFPTPVPGASAHALLPAPGPADATDLPPAGPPSTAGFPALRPRTAVTAAASPTLGLPVLAGTASWEWIRQAVLTDHRLPPRDAVRLEEILNHFTLRPEGSEVAMRLPAGTWHPDDRSLGTSTHAATIACETMVCPWRPSASLVLVSIRGNPFSDCDLQAVFRAHPATVSRYRLLGFAPVVGQPRAPLPTRLPAQTTTTLVLEIETATPAADLGTIEWSVNGQPAEPLTITRQDDSDPSADARFAALVCSFAQWLASDPSAGIDREMVAALARECVSPTLPADRADFLALIDRALRL